MSGRKRPPLLGCSSLTGTVFIVTRYHKRTEGAVGIVADEKWPVTDEEFEEVVRQWRLAQRRKKRKTA